MPYSERDIAYFDSLDQDEPLEEENADDMRDRLEAIPGAFHDLATNSEMRAVYEEEMARRANGKAENLGEK